MAALALTAFGLCAAGKVHWWLLTDSSRPPLVRLLAADAVVIAGLWLLLNFIRSRAPGRLPTVVAIAVMIPVWGLAVLEAVSLTRTGAPLHVSALRLAVVRWGDVSRAGTAEVGLLTALRWPLLAAVPLLFAALVRLRRRHIGPPLVLPAAILLAGGGGGFLVSVEAHDDPVYLTNVHLRLVRQWGGAQAGLALASGPIEPTTDELGTVIPSAASRPDIAIVVLESIGYHATSLAHGVGADTTPFLAELAAHGLSTSDAYTAVPHTSKALVAILCGDYPSRNTEIIEAADNYPLTCLPRYLAAAGYRSLFIQSADGTFEQRPRLIERMGFDELLARQDLEGTASVGYLGGDDRAMTESVVDWLNRGSEPALVTVLTSVAHHPYLIPADGEAAAAVNGADDPVVRYENVVRWTDAWLADFVRRLGEAGRMEHTLLIVVGDHGEAVGGVVTGHSNVYAERVLHVPLVLFGAGVSSGGRADGLRGLIDILPTVLGVSGVRPATPPSGHDLLGPSVPDRILFSSSWFHDAWLAALQGDTKLLVLPDSGERVLLERSTDLSSGRVEPGAAAALEASVGEWAESTYFQAEAAMMPERTFFEGRWGCDAEVCWRADTGIGMLPAPRSEPVQTPPIAAVVGADLHPLFARNRAVAHALGGIDGMAYTNSLEALSRSLERGFRLLEVDLVPDEVEGLICFHEHGDHPLQWPAGDTEGALRDALFAGRFPIPTAREVLERVASEPEVHLVIDTKREVVGVLEDLVAIASDVDPALVQRIVPQIYAFGDLAAVRALADFETVVLTLYRMPDTPNEAILEFVTRNRIPAVVMPPERADPEFLRRLREAGAATYIHTLNTSGDVREALDRGAHGVFTDFDDSLLRGWR